MNFNYEEYLTTQLNFTLQDLELDSKYNILVANEQIFTKIKSYAPNTIYIVIKYLSSQYAYNTKVLPVQLLILGEQNAINDTQTIFNYFTQTYNWKQESINGDYIKQQYNSPVVVSNFNDVANGYRSVLYVGGSLYIMENVLDVKNVKITIGNVDVEVKPLNFSLTYAMNGNTQQISGDFISSTVKATSVATISMTLPFLDNALSDKIISISSGAISGNYNFVIKFNIGNSATPYTYNMKLQQATITTAPDQVSGLNVSFIK